MARRNKSRAAKMKNKAQPNLASAITALTRSLAPPVARQKTVYKPRLQPASRYLASLLDPFAATSAGVKLPDFDSNPSYTVASKDVVQITTDTYGYAGGVFWQGISGRKWTVSASNTGGTVTLTGGTNYNWNDANSGLLTVANCNGIRLVTGGIRLTNLLSVSGNNAASGRLILAPLSNAQVYDTASFAEGDLRKQPGCMVIPLAALAASSAPVEAVAAPLDPSAFCYVGSNRTPTGVANDDPQFTSFVYMIVGAPASSILMEVECVANWEALPMISNATLCTPGVESSTTILEKAFNWVQTNNPISWESAADFSAQALYAFGQQRRAPRLMNG